MYRGRTVKSLYIHFVDSIPLDRYSVSRGSISWSSVNQRSVNWGIVSQDSVSRIIVSVPATLHSKLKHNSEGH